MAFDVEIREVRSWEVKVLLRNEASESNTSAATTWISNPRTIRLCPPNPALFVGRLLIAKFTTELFQRKNLIQFSHAFSFPNKRISSNSVHELFFHFIFAFLSRNVHFLFRRGSDLHTWKWLLVRWDDNESPPFRPRPPARVPWFLTLSLF